MAAQAYVKQFKMAEQEAARYIAVFPCELKVGHHVMMLNSVHHREIASSHRTNSFMESLPFIQSSLISRHAFHFISCRTSMHLRGMIRGRGATGSLQIEILPRVSHYSRSALCSVPFENRVILFGY